MSSRIHVCGHPLTACGNTRTTSCGVTAGAQQCVLGVRATAGSGAGALRAWATVRCTQVPASRRRQVLRFRFKVGGVPSVDPGQVHRRGGDGVVTNVAVLPAVPMRGNTAAAVRSGARVALAAALRGPPVDFDAKS